ncbi:MAG: EAL domain-containing protein [Peptococcaceae bacterium]|nr:EAL domain-containing protein [Peptococcaceae bacterium]
MDTKIDIYQAFARRMGLLALLTGLTISLLMPLTYFTLSLHDLQGRTSDDTTQVAAVLSEQAPQQWSESAQRFAKLADDVAQLKVYDTKGELTQTSAIRPIALLHIRQRRPILLNKQLLGYVDLTMNTGSLLSSTLLLLVVSLVIGVLIGTLVYRFPARAVRRAEGEIGEAFAKMRHLSYHDALTNLPNRIQLNDRLTQCLRNAKRSEQKVAVIFLDLDDFKNINDTLGHSIGDLLLRQVATRLTNCIREGDTVARLGGDEFVILLPQISVVLDASRVAKRVLDFLAQPFTLDGHELVVTTSIGISVYPADGDNIETLVQNADTAMYRAKEQGKNKYQFYTPEMNAKALERLTLENNLRRAIKQQELQVFYQPIIELYSGDIIGMEALARWNHPEMGLIVPNRFIPLAEETGLIVPLGEWILRTACKQTKEWQDADMLPMYISVNISARQFLHHGLVDTVIEVLQETGLDPIYLQLEITESIAAYDEKRVSDKLQTLRNLGIKIAIDDFGTGYSSLGSLKKFPFQTLKIDKSFIDNIVVDAYDAAITTTIIAMANSLNLSVVAEGVENEDQLAYLLEHGCSAMQGYLFCRPLPKEEIEKTLIQRKLQKVVEMEAAVGLS